MSSELKALEQKIGRIEFHDMPTSWIACMGAVLRLNGISTGLEDLLDVVPVPRNGASERLIERFARRVGIKMTPIPIPSPLDLPLENKTILIARPSGYFMLVFSTTTSNHIIGLPGHYPCEFPTESDVLSGAAAAWRLEFMAEGAALKRIVRPCKLFLIDNPARSKPKYDPADVIRVQSLLSRCPHRPAPPLALNDLTPASLLASHRAIYPALNGYYGAYRPINLRRHMIFLDHTVIAETMESLLDCARQARTNGLNNIVGFAARLYVDFLTIHPFINANRRMAEEVVARWLVEQNMGIRWNVITKTQRYYLTRCAAHGHFKGLENALRISISRKAI